MRIQLLRDVKKVVSRKLHPLQFHKGSMLEVECCQGYDNCFVYMVGEDEVHFSGRNIRQISPLEELAQAGE